MKTKIIIFFLLLLLSSCGYEAIHSKKNSKSYNFSIDKIDLIEEKINFVVQINGKKRAILNIKRDMIENDIIEIIKINAEIEKFFKEQKIKKSIFVPNRLINIII